MRRAICLSALLLASACSEANHLGNPLTWPISGLATAIENAAYDRQRGIVKSWLTAHADGLRKERFNGPLMAELLATIPSHHRERVRSEIAALAGRPDFAEAATIVVMVHR